MKWITRANVKVDRAACPRLIRNFVAPDAEFLFVRVDQAQIEINGCADFEFDQG